MNGLEELISRSELHDPPVAKALRQLESALLRISGDYFTSQVEGEEEWQFLDRELTATKEYAEESLVIKKG